jgi:hypothetical protein
MKPGKIILLFIFLLPCRIGHAQESAHNLIQVGIKGIAGVSKITEINDFAVKWIDNIETATNVSITNKPSVVPYNFEYGFQPYLTIRPLRFFQAGIKMDYAISPLKVKLQNELNLKLTSFIPGVYASLRFGNFEIGGGLLHSFTRVNIKDDFLGYYDSWNGKNYGYEVNMGIISPKGRYFGYTMNISYRSLFINELTDNYKRTVTHSDSNQNFKLDLTGVVLNLGIYLNFINIGKCKPKISDTL